MLSTPARPLPRPIRARGRLVVLLGAVVATVAGALVGVVAPLAVAPTVTPAAAATSYGAPSWWDGDCDTNNWTRKARAAGWTGAPASRLGGVVLGIPVCGPRALAGAPNIWWSRAGWGELEWQCVEFAQRFMIQVYGVSPYQANGVEVVNHYTTAQGGGLVRVDNGTVGKAPQPGDVMSFSSPSNRYGHVAVVASTSVDGNGNGTVRLATQNDTADGWRTLTVKNWVTQAFGSLYPYAWLHDPQGRGGGNGVTDGSFVLNQGAIYRIVGGAPVYVSSWTPFGGGRPYVAITDAEFAALRTTPRDGTFLRAAGGDALYRTVGGAPLHVTSCAPAGFNGCSGYLDVDPAAIARAGTGGYYDHLLPTVPDTTLVRRADGPDQGWIGVGIGGSLLHVTDCGPYAGCAGYVDIDSGSYSEYLAAHPAPRDGAVALGKPSGALYRWTGGRCAAVSSAGGATPVPVNDASLSCAARMTVATTPTGALVAGRSSNATLTATGGSGSLSWSMAGGSLPAGLTLAAGGGLRGTPTTPGTTTVAVQVRDLADPAVSTTAAVTLTVVAALVGSTTTVPMTVGTAADVQLVPTGGSGPYTWTITSGKLLKGLTLSASGRLTGTPLSATTRTVTLRVVDSAGQRTAVSLVLAVSPAATSATPAAPGAASVAPSSASPTVPAPATTTGG